MGCCCSQENSYDESESRQDTRLLREHPINGNGARVTNISQSSSLPAEDFRGSNNTLNTILRDIAGQLIDVTQTDSETYDHLDHNARARAYSAKLLEIMPQMMSNVSCSQQSDDHGVSIPIVVLSGSPIQESDILQVTNAATKFAAAICSMKVISKDPIVVPLLSNQ